MYATFRESMKNYDRCYDRGPTKTPTITAHLVEIVFRYVENYVGIGLFALNPQKGLSLHSVLRTIP
jgi:hypothetical protein